MTIPNLLEITRTNAKHMAKRDDVAGVANNLNACADEIERLRDIIDCGCNAITDALNLGGPDLVRVGAMVRRMRSEMSGNRTKDQQ